MIQLPGGQGFQFEKQVMPDGPGDFAGGNGGHPVGYDVQHQTHNGAQQHPSPGNVDLPQISGGYFFVQNDFHQIGDQ